MFVDSLAEKYPGWTPYHYVHNSPINLIDPTGMEAEGWGKKGNTWEYDEKITADNFESLVYDKYMEKQLFPNRRAAYDWEAAQNRVQKGPLNKNNH